MYSSKFVCILDQRFYIDLAINFFIKKVLISATCKMGASSVKFPSSHSISLRSYLLLSFHLLLGVPNYLFISSLTLQNSAFFFSSGYMHPPTNSCPNSNTEYPYETRNFPFCNINCLPTPSLHTY
jgi:hypothetical protein